MLIYDNNNDNDNEDGKDDDDDDDDDDDEDDDNSYQSACPLIEFFLEFQTSFPVRFKRGPSCSKAA